MTVETATYISQLNTALPSSSDPKSEGDDHVRLLKSALKATFPNFGAAALASSNTQLDKVVTTFSVASAPSGAVTVDASGNVGIGVSSPDAKLRVDAASPTRGICISAVGAGSTGAQMMVSQSGVASWAFGQPPGVSAFAWFVNRSPAADGTELMRLDDNGNLILSPSGAAPTLSNRQMVITSPSNTQLLITVKGADGVTRTATIPLA